MGILKSLDPRINRLNIPETQENPLEKEQLDQWDTYEVFVQTKEGKPFQHEGIVHASNENMAFIFAKEQFSRRFTCTGIWVAKTNNIKITEYTDAQESIYDKINPVPENEGEEINYEVFHLMKRGKQHKHAGRVKAKGYNEALVKAKDQLKEEKPVFNVWVIRSSDIFYSKEDDKEIWNTLPEKKFRDAIDYKAGDKLKKFKEEKSKN